MNTPVWLSRTPAAGIVRWPLACVTGVAAAAAPVRSTAARRALRSRRSRPRPRISVSLDSHIWGTAKIGPSCALQARSPWQACAARTSASPWKHGLAYKPYAVRSRAQRRRPPAACEPARPPFFCSVLLHHIDLQVALYDQPARPGVFLHKILESLDIAAGHLAKTSSPDIDHPLAHGMTLGHIGHRILVGIAQDLDDLLVGNTALLQRFFATTRKPSSHDSTVLKNQGQVKCIYCNS